MKIFANKFGAQENVVCGLVKLIKPDNELTRETEYPIPLTEVHVNAIVVHAVAQVEVTQVYVNKETQPIEAIYYFPINPDGAVTRFEAELDGKIIKGKVKEHEKAKKAYKKAVENQTTALLGEETKADIFKISVGFLKPGSQVKVTVEYITEVKNEAGTNAIRFYIPTTIAPRYVSPSEMDENAENIRNMVFSEFSPAPLSLRVEVNLQDAIKCIKSPTHAIRVGNIVPIPGKTCWKKCVVELKASTIDMDRDFVLNIELETPHKPRLYSEKMADASTAMMIHWIPSFKVDEIKPELIFVLDRSGSMSGKSIELAKKTLLKFLHSIPADCYFNIVGFGSDYKFLFPNSVKYDDDTLKQSVKHTKKLEANLGGTELLEPLNAIYQTGFVEGYMRQIFVITDGHVCDTDAVIGTVKNNASTTRVFALGIGASASHHLVEGIAKAGGGTSAFVSYNERFDKKVLNQLKIALQPALTQLELKWEGLKVPPVTEHMDVTENKLSGCSRFFSSFISYNNTRSVPTNAQSPRSISSVFNGTQLLVFGMFSKECPCAVTLTALSPDGPVTISIEHSNTNEVGSSGVLHRLAGLKLVRELEIEVAVLYATSMKRHIGRRKEKLLKNQILKIALKNSLSSRYTSFVAIDKSILKNCCPKKRTMETRIIELQVDDEWYGGRGIIEEFRCNLNLKSMERVTFRSFGSRSRRPIPTGAAFACARSYNGPPLERGCRSLLSQSPIVIRIGGLCSLSHQGSLPSIPSPPPPISRPPPSISPPPENPVEENLRSKSDSEDTDDDGDTPLDKLISLQSFDGSFALSTGLSDVIGVPLDTLRTCAESRGLPEKVFATAVAVCFFESKLESEADVWALVVKKAKGWLTNNVDNPQQIEELKAGAFSF